MLARLLRQAVPAEHRIEPRREAVVLPFSRAKSVATRIDWYAKYPCTRMHGAAFEAEFYPVSDELP